MSMDIRGKYKPYPAYKHNDIEWLGEVPEHWMTTTLKHVCKKITDGSHFSPKNTNDGKPYVTVRNINSGNIDLNGAAKISFEDFTSLERAGCRPKKGDVLFSKDGTIGKAAIVEDDDFVVLSSLAILSPYKGRLDSKYLFYFLHANCGEKQIESLYAGAALKRITLDAIVGIYLPIPTITVQQIIATFLDRETAKIDALITKQERLIELLQEKRSALISHAVTKGLNPDAPMKNSGVEWLGEVPEHWEAKRLKYSLRLLTEKTDRRENPVALENIQSWTGRFMPTETIFEGEGVAFLPGDILFGKLRPYLAKALYSGPRCQDHGPGDLR